MSISGDIDMYSSPMLRKALLDLAAKKNRVLILDLGETAYIDSSGIATFVEGLKCVKTYNGQLKFVRIPPRIEEIFNFSKLDKVFSIYGNLDDAISG